MTNNSDHIFSNIDIRKLLIPIMLENLLASLMGTVDTMMVSNVGASAVSAVSLVDSINILVIQALSALAAGGAILCSQYIGSSNPKGANRAARQVFLVMTVLSVLISAICLVLRVPMLKFIFGSVEAEVMADSQAYFLFTLLSFPFIGLYDAGASIMRAQKDSKSPMTISIISNFLNIGGNAILIFGLGMGVAGAAISTLVSRVFCAVVVIIKLRNPSQTICVNRYYTIRPDWDLIKKVLYIGIPSGIENSMFQFGKLAIQSTVSLMGTAAIAAQGMASIIENLNGIMGIGIGIGLMTVVGETLGAGRKEEAVYYVKKLCIVSEVVIIASCLLLYALVRPITYFGGMEPESAKMCIFMVTCITIVKPLIWVMAFVPAYGFRAAGDVKFTMTVSILTMWLCRVTLSIVLARVFGFGPIAVWIGMFSDWALRGVIFTIRFRNRKWLNHHVI